jgi:hypothetical protein
LVNKFEMAILQDLVLLFAGVFLLLLTASNFLGLNGFLTFVVACGLMLISTVDLIRVTFKIQPERIN